MSERTWQHEDQRADIERYCRTEGVDFDRAWEALHTAFDAMTDEQIALATHMMGWAVRDLGLQNGVVIAIERVNGS